MGNNQPDSNGGFSAVGDSFAGEGTGLALTAETISGALALISQAGGAVSIPKPFENKICLVDDGYVAGSSHVDGIEEMVEGLESGTKLEFQRDPENRFDSNAIKVFLPGKGRIGFVPVDCNQIIARLMDGGKHVFGEVTELDHFGCWIRIGMGVYLDD